MWNMGQKACESQRLVDGKPCLVVVTGPCIHVLIEAVAASTGLHKPSLSTVQRCTEREEGREAPYLAEQSLAVSDCW